MSALEPQIAVFIQNDSGMDIPPRSVVVCTSVETSPTGPGQETRSIHHVNQYGCGMAGNVLVTGNLTIAAGNQGRGYFDQFLYVAIDDSIAVPTPGEEWGPANGTWTVTRGGVGFFAQGYSDTGADPDRSMFLRTFKRAKPTVCSSSSSSQSSSSTSSSESTSGSSTSSSPCGCIQVVTSVVCSPSGLAVNYGQARGCC